MLLFQIDFIAVCVVYNLINSRAIFVSPLHEICAFFFMRSLPVVQKVGEYVSKQRFSSI